MAITMDAREARRRVRPCGAADRARALAFRRARRHSLLVKMLRVALPVGAVGVTGFYALTLGVSWQLGTGRLNVGEVQLTADDLTMKNPKYFGVTKDGGRYEVRAKKAILEFNQEAPIKLIDIDGDLLQPNNVVTKLKAKHGLLDNAKSELELYDGIEIDASNGMKARMSRATVYSKEHRVVSKQPVDLDDADRHGARRVHDHAHRHARGDLRRRRRRRTSRPRRRPAQQPRTPAFGRDSRQPVDVTAEQLYVNDTTRRRCSRATSSPCRATRRSRRPSCTSPTRARPPSELTGADAAATGGGSRLSRLVAKNGTVITIGTDRRVSSDAGRVRRQGRYRAVHRQRGRQPAEECAAGQAAVRRPQDRQEPPRDAGGRRPAGRPHRRHVLPGREQDRRAAQAEVCSAGEAAGAVQGGMLGSFKIDPNAPMDIEADTLDVFDAEPSRPSSAATSSRSRATSSCAPSR